MYAFLVRRTIRRNIDRLNAGDYAPLLALAAADAELRFPGDNSWSTQFRPAATGRSYVASHRGRAELERFAERFVRAGLHIDIDDILVSGPPWNTRVCVRATDRALDPDGGEIYANRVAVLIETRWGRIRRWEDYLDTERVGAWDRRVAAGGPAPATAVNG